MNNQKEIVKKIKILMIKKDIKNEEMYKMLGLTSDAWLKRLNLVVRFRIEEIKRIAEFLNVPIDEIV